MTALAYDPNGAQETGGHLASLDTKAATSANQSTEITALAAILADLGTALTNQATMIGDLASLIATTGRIPAQGQALAAASTPVVLTALQQAALTPPAAISGFATSAKQPALGTAGSASADVVSVQGVAGGTTVQVGGISLPASASFTRSANTTAYSANQVVAPATTGGATAIAGCVQAAGRSGLLLSVTLVDAVNAATPLQPVILLFNAAPTSLADNAALALVSGDVAKLVHIVPLFESYLTNGSASPGGQRIWVARGLSIPYSIASGTGLFAYVLSGAAYTPVSGEVFTLILGTEQN